MSQVSTGPTRVRNLTDLTVSECHSVQSAVWIRESSILAMHCAIERILALDAVLRMRSSDNDVRTSLGSLVGMQVRTMADVRNSEKSLREQETRIIGKYNVIKTDMHFQKAFVLKLLEGVLNIFKRLMSLYSQNELSLQRSDLRREVDFLKGEIKTTVQAREFVLTEILSQLINFSRGRLEGVLLILERVVGASCVALTETAQSTLLKTVPIHSWAQRSGQTILKPFIREGPKTSLKDIQPATGTVSQGGLPTPKRMFLVKRVEISKSIQESPRSPDQGKRNESDHVEESSDGGKQIERRVERRSKLRNSVAVAAKQEDQQAAYSSFAQYYNHTTKASGSWVLSDAEGTTESLAYYREANQELRALSESEQKAVIFRWVKELGRGNAVIEASIDGFRKNYQAFLKRMVEKQQEKVVVRKSSRCGQQRQAIAGVWASLSLKSSSMNGMGLDSKEICKLVSAMARGRKQANSMKEQQQVGSGRMQSQPAEPVGKMRQSQSRSTKAAQENQEVRSNYYEQQFYSPKMRCDVKALNCVSYDYFNL